MAHPECIPIVMDLEDGFFPKGHCLDISRSAAFVFSPSSCTPLSLGDFLSLLTKVTDRWCAQTCVEYHVIERKSACGRLRDVASCRNGSKNLRKSASETFDTRYDQRLEQGDNILKRLITSDEAWLYCYDPTIK
ncbi:hypothetical protein TNCV_4272771 [Trichonephila clavipes]|nr:hypothetical protein TNCV_4272771 [Trichonephila clavipes]